MFKVGDRVKIKSLETLLKENKINYLGLLSYPGWTNEMNFYAGTLQTINYIGNVIKFNNVIYSFSPDWIELAINLPKNFPNEIEGGNV